MADNRDLSHVTSYKTPLSAEEAERLGAYAARHVGLDAEFVRALRGAQHEAFEGWAQVQAEDENQTDGG